MKRARALTVNELILLETYLIDGTDNHEDRYASGCFLFCTYARARWGDLVSVADFVNDTVSSGGQSYGYLEFAGSLLLHRFAVCRAGLGVWPGLMLQQTQAALLTQLVGQASLS